MSDDAALVARAVAEHFVGTKAPIDVETLGEGHIHETWRATATDGPSLVLQRLNTRVFPDLALVMKNVDRVSTHLAAKYRGRPDAARRTLTLVRDESGALLHAADGAMWRAFHYIPKTRTYQTIASEALARETGRAFGTFAVDVADLPASELGVPLPNFHDLARRRADFEEAARADPCGRATGCAGEIDAYGAAARALESELSRGGAEALPERVVHNDCKLNNLLFDERSFEALCVIDLDTVMPGSLLHDFGDLARTATCPEPEDSVRLDRVTAEPRLLTAIGEAFAEAAASILAPLERELMPLAGPLITLETGLRFLTDHLTGDTYFPAHEPNQNRTRSRVQLQLFESLNDQRERIADAFRS